MLTQKDKPLQRYNLIVVFNQHLDKILFCKRQKDPYKGLYNFVGGKLNPNEDGFVGAYRELYEETGIESTQIRLYHILDTVYYNQDCVVEVYVGHLYESDSITLKEEVNPLKWLSAFTDFSDTHVFAGDGSVDHIIKQATVFRWGK